MLHFLLHNAYDSKISSQLCTSQVVRTRGHALKLFSKHCALDVSKFFFTIRIVRAWNSLAASVVNSISVSAFKFHLSSSDVSVHLSY